MKAIEFNPANWVDNKDQLRIIQDNSQNHFPKLAVIKSTNVTIRIHNHEVTEDLDGDTDFDFHTADVEIKDGKNWEATDIKVRKFGSDKTWTSTVWT